MLFAATLVALVLVCAFGHLAVGRALPSVGMSGGASSSGGPRSARPDLSPASRLNTKLPAVAPTSFAGLIVDGDRGVIVYVTVIEPALTDAIAEVQASTPGGVDVRVVSGVRNSFAALMRIRDQITARQPELAAEGITLTRWGPDIVANRVRIGVHNLTPEISAKLAREFGADQIVVEESGFVYWV